MIVEPGIEPKSLTGDLIFHGDFHLPNHFFHILFEDVEDALEFDAVDETERLCLFLFSMVAFLVMQARCNGVIEGIWIYGYRMLRWK